MNEDILRELRARVSEYSDTASLSRNAHMNSWRGDDPAPAGFAVIVTAFLETVPDFPGRGGTIFYTHLVAWAKAYMEQDPENQLIKSILVDYINWASFRFFCMDLGLYTCDV